MRTFLRRKLQRRGKRGPEALLFEGYNDSLGSTHNLLLPALAPNRPRRALLYGTHRSPETARLFFGQFLLGLFPMRPFSAQLLVAGRDLFACSIFRLKSVHR